MEKLKNLNKVVGIKQTKAAVRKGEAQTVYIADDADKNVISGLEELCRGAGLDPMRNITVKELGSLCGIDVPCAAAAVLKKP